MEERRLPFDPQRTPWSDASALRRQYRYQLAELDDELIGMCRQVVEMTDGIADLGPVPRADRGAVARATLLSVRDRAGQLEDAAFTLVALESPVGGDLRELVAIIRAVADVLRSGQLALHILEAIGALEEAGIPTTGGDLARLRTAAVDIFRAAVTAWDDRDALAYNELSARDDEVDRLKDLLLERGPGGGDHRCAAAHALSVRFLERLADHGVNLCGHLSWAITGDRVLAVRGT